MDAIAGGLAFGVAFAASLSLMPLVKMLGARVGMVDAPGTRKIHSKTAVRAGGLGVALGILIALTAIIIAFFEEGESVRPLLAIGALALPVAIIGVIEDATTVKPKVRLAFQGLGVVSFLALMFGIIETYAASIGIPTLAVAAVAGFVLLAGINAVNLIDGIDGLAASMVMLSGLGIASIYGIDTFSSTPSLALAGALLGFLPWNLREKSDRRLFLGDGGSTLIGALITSMALTVVLEHPSHDKAVGFDFLLIVGLVGLPLIDEGVSVVRRLAMKRSPLEADQSHIHHFLILANSTKERPHRYALRDLILLQAVIVVATVASFHVEEYRWYLAGFAGLFVVGMYARMGVLTPRFIQRGRMMSEALAKIKRMPKDDAEAEINVDALKEALEAANFAYARLFDRNSRETIALQAEEVASKEVRLPIPSISPKDNDVLVIGVWPGFFRDYGLASLISPSLPSLRRARRLLAQSDSPKVEYVETGEDGDTRKIRRVTSRNPTMKQPKK